MNKKLSVSTAMFVLAGLIVAGVATAHAQTVIVSDSFTNSVNHPNTYVSINGDSPETTSPGVGAWVASTWAQMTPAYNGLATAQPYTGGATAEIAIPTPTTNAYIVSANFFTSPSNNIDPTSYFSIGFENTASSNWFGLYELDVMALPNGDVPNTGVINVFNEWGNLVQQVNGLTFTPTENIAFMYDPVSSTYVVFANGVNVTGVHSVDITYTAGPIGSAGVLAGDVSNYVGLVPVLYDFKVIAVSGPIILQQPVSRACYVGQSSQFTAAATGTPTPSYHWQIITNGNHVNLSDGGNISGSATPTLTISNLVSANNGANYAVVITNSSGSVTSSIATLTVDAANGNILWDSFTNTTVHPLFTSINGQPPEIGAGTWASGSGELINSSNGFAAVGSAPQGEIAIPAPTNAITVQADLFPTNYNNWIGFGFQIAPDTGGGWYGSSNLLWLIVNYGHGTNSSISVMGANTAVLHTFSGLTFTPDEKVALTYDPVADTCSVLANGVTLTNGFPVTLSAAIGSVGFLGNGPLANPIPLLKNFSVGYAPVTPPSPPVLTNSWNGSQLILSWPPGYTLQTATNVVGPWTSTAAVSPVPVAPSLPQQYFRLLSN